MSPITRAEFELTGSGSLLLGIGAVLFHVCGSLLFVCCSVSGVGCLPAGRLVRRGFGAIAAQVPEHTSPGAELDHCTVSGAGGRDGESG